LLERFGSPVAGRTLLEPGAHLKWPWPIDKIYRFRTEQIQTLEVGPTEEAPTEREPAVLWTMAHSKEDNFLVANRETRTEDTTNQISGRRIPPVSLLTVAIPVQYQITNLPAWAYKNEDAPSLLQDIATREVVRYLVSADLNELMTSGRLEAGKELVNRIQAAADERELGARVIAVGLQDIHPPVKVGKDYESVVGAQQTKLAKILEARADEIRTNALADAQAVTVLNGARADAMGRKVGAWAQAGLFTNRCRPSPQHRPFIRRWLISRRSRALRPTRANTSC
jgi:membrane protease subunit HflK